MTTKACPHCGKSVPPSLGTKPRKWCSNACHVRDWQIRTGRYPQPRTCAVSFPTCLICETVFAARVGGKRAKRATCSDECFRLWRNEKERQRHANLRPDLVQAKLERKMLRRALEAGVEAERFTPLEIFERDAWSCGLCDGPVDQSLKYPDPMCASIDHVTPVKLGGSHTRGNVQCAHLVCNLRKGTRVAEAVA